MMGGRAPLGVDAVGLGTLAAALLLAAGYLLCCQYIKWRRGAISNQQPIHSSCFRLAAARGDLRAMITLASAAPPAGFSVDAAAPSSGFTALHAACVMGQFDAALWLCAHGADVKATKRDGWHDTALQYAAAHGHTDIASMLLSFGADVHAKNFAGATAADLAAKTGQLDCAAHLANVAAGLEPVRPPDPYIQHAADLDALFGAQTNASSAELQLPRLLLPAPSSATQRQRRWLQMLSCCFASSRRRHSRSCSGEVPVALISCEQQHHATSRIVETEPGRAAAADAAPVSSPAGAKARPLGSTPGTLLQLPSCSAAVRQLLSDDECLRAWEGEGSPGTELVATARLYRPLICVTQVLAFAYLLRRAARSCTAGWLYLLSLPVLLAETLMQLMGQLFMLSLWRQVRRPQRWLEDMLPPESFPTVDVFIVCCNEPVEVIEPTCIAALNLNYAGSRLAVHVLDDGDSPSVRDMVQRLQQQARWMQREATIAYTARDKVAGVPHHAKAGNINSALLKEAPGCGDFVLVLDCDMIPHPDLLMRVLGHFYRQEASVAGGGACQWVLKDKAAFVQTPQDFYNVDKRDPLANRSAFFYSVMLQGRDGIGAAPCCGTGVVFRRDVLVSIGGQAYNSITEDYNTAMELLAAGFATMFLNERLAAGQAPDDLPGVLKQRLRWAMGAIQILLRDNPLTRPGLTLTQSLLFWEAAAHHFVAPAIILLSLLPIIYLFTEVSPVAADQLWEFCIFFLAHYGCSRLLLWTFHCEGGSEEIWRGSQMGVWISFNHCKAIWQVMLTELPLLKWLTNKQIAFKVTKKAATRSTAAAAVAASDHGALREALRAAAPFLAYYAAVVAAVVWVAVHAALGRYTLWRGALLAGALGWALLVCLSMLPPVETLMPRQETAEQGWKIRWDVFLPVSQPLRTAASATSAAVTALLTPRHRRNSQLGRTTSQQLPGSTGEPESPGCQRQLEAAVARAGQHRASSAGSAEAVSSGTAHAIPLTGCLELDAALLQAAHQPKPPDRPTAAAAAAGVSPVAHIQRHQTKLDPCSPLRRAASLAAAEHACASPPGRGYAAAACAASSCDAELAHSSRKLEAAGHSSSQSGAFAGRVSLPAQTQRLREQSILLTGLVLPERQRFSGLSNSRRQSSASISRTCSWAHTDHHDVELISAATAAGTREWQLGLGLSQLANAAVPVAAQDSNDSSGRCSMDFQQGHHAQGPVLLLGRHGQLTADSQLVGMAWHSRSTADEVMTAAAGRSDEQQAAAANRSSSTAVPAAAQPVPADPARPRRRGVKKAVTWSAACFEAAAERPVAAGSPVGSSSVAAVHQQQTLATAAGTARRPVRRSLTTSALQQSQHNVSPARSADEGLAAAAAPVTIRAAAQLHEQHGSQLTPAGWSQLPPQHEQQHAPHHHHRQQQPPLSWLQTVDESRSLRMPAQAAAGGDAAESPGSAAATAGQKQGAASDWSVQASSHGVMSMLDIDGDEEAAAPDPQQAAGSAWPGPRLLLPAASVSQDAALAGLAGLLHRTASGASTPLALETWQGGPHHQPHHRRLSLLRHGSVSSALAAADFSPVHGARGSTADLARDAAADGSPAAESMVHVPVEPGGIFEASIAARPNFDGRTSAPGGSWMYLAVNCLILLVLVGGAVVELVGGRHV